MDKDIFISYSHTDVELARNLAALLEAHGYSVWWDNHLKAGENYRQTIASRIEGAGCVIVLFSTRSVHSSWVLDEASRGLHLKKLVPLVVGETTVPFGFGSQHHIGIDNAGVNPQDATAETILGSVESMTNIAPGSFDQSVFETGLKDSLPDRYTKRSRFAIRWWPRSVILKQMLSLIAIYLFALIIAFGVDSNTDSIRQWLQLIHSFSGMIVLGGGLFLLAQMRYSDRQPSAVERMAIGDAARFQMSTWRLSALAQFVTGGILTSFIASGEGFSVRAIPAWTIEAIGMYTIAVFFWWRGFSAGLKALRFDSLMQRQEVILAFRRARDLNLTIGLVLTGWVLIVMIYKNDAEFIRVLDQLAHQLAGVWRWLTAQF